MEQTKKFQELLKDAPLASNNKTERFLGTVARIEGDDEKFLLTLPNGCGEKLKVAAVKWCRRIPSAIGQFLVELELDLEDVPPDFKKVLSDSARSQAHKDIFGGNVVPFMAFASTSSFESQGGGMGPMAPPAIPMMAPGSHLRANSAKARPDIPQIYYWILY
jgi:hypothetical protein